MNAADFAAAQTIDERELGEYVEPRNPGSHVVSMLNFHVDLIRRLTIGERITGDKLPWSKTWGQFRFRPGETTLWFGINGHGKSAVTSQVAVWLGINGIKSCVASFEMAPVDTLERMILQAAGNPKPGLEFINDFFFTMCRNVWLYDRSDRIDVKMLFAAIRYCAEVKGTTHFFVDSLMKCVRGSDDYSAQKNFVDDLMRVGKETGTHIHLIHHSKKLESENSVPNKFDARGAGEITDQVHNVISVWRNKAKERDNESALEMGSALTKEGPDFILTCDKQRNGHWEGKWALWGDPQTWHFRQSLNEPWTRGYELPEKAFRQQDEPGANG